uniref:Uncharacterized protein n=1 Tax=Cucumis melo TaxID=3656 RepID=A0A9I9EF20_CUCME
MNLLKRIRKETENLKKLRISSSSSRDSEDGSDDSFILIRFHDSASRSFLSLPSIFAIFKDNRGGCGGSRS